MTPTTVGFLYPGFGAEDDYPRAERLLGETVTLPLVHTSVGEDAHRVDALLDLGGPGRLAVGLDALRGFKVSAVVWACTSGSFVYGWEGAREQVAALSARSGVPATSTSFAFVDAAHALGIRRVAVAATYPSEVAEHFVVFLTSGGLDVVQATSRGILTAAEVGRLGQEDVLELAKANDHPSADAVLLPDTALHSIAWLDNIEAELGKPVLTANQVSIWAGLRLAGHTDHHERLGTLFRCAGTAGPGPQ